MADIEFTNEPELETTGLQEAIVSDSELKNWLVDFVGDKHSPEDGQVTVEMVVHTMADEFPELLMAIAEENWIRGYQQAIHDVTVGEKLIKEEAEKREQEDDTSESD
tara:strand:- start:5436 stop:5756 length:321 start_codon:yes stop_codon:yes gene_type:complete